ncbi:MAG: hypothetical protein KatS3mg002_0174 [Candidatus Woesearchaeota archaeon]|nr:MAG: hypothetical protein KatS3mg002_0174 [Candidatus Woesearchaeota archaeon]
MVQYKLRDKEKLEEILIESIINTIKEANHYLKNKIPYEHLNSENIHDIYLNPDYIGWWNYEKCDAKVFSIMKIFNNNKNFSGLMMDYSGIAITYGEIKQHKDNRITSIKLNKKYIGLFNHKNEYFLQGNNSLIEAHQNRIFGKVYIRNKGIKETAEFGIEIKHKSYTIEKILESIYLSNLLKINNSQCT